MKRPGRPTSDEVPPEQPDPDTPRLESPPQAQASAPTLEVQDHFEPSRQILRDTVRHTLAPAIARGYATLDEAQTWLREDVAEQLTDTRIPQADLAAHLGRSESWFRKNRSAIVRRRGRLPGGQRSVPLGGMPARGNEVAPLCRRVLNLFYTVGSRPLTPDEIRDVLQLSRREISDEALFMRLELYARLGHLDRLTLPNNEPAFTARTPRPSLSAVPADHACRSERS